MRAGASSSGVWGASRCSAKLWMTLRGDQAHLFPFSGSFAFARTGGHGADHRPIALGDHVIFPDGRQKAKRLRIFFLQPGSRSLRMSQRGLTHPAGAQLKAVMLPHALSRPGKRMFAAKISQSPLQSAGFSARADSQASRKGAHIFSSRAPPNLIAHAHEPKHTPPGQRFFLRFKTVGSWSLRSALTRS